jgi:hypothetical protein
MLGFLKCPGDRIVVGFCRNSPKLFDSDSADRKWLNRSKNYFDKKVEKVSFSRR